MAGMMKSAIRMGGGKGLQTKGDFKSIKKVIAYCKPYYFSIVVALLFAVDGAILTIVGPDKVRELISIITEGIMVGIDMSAFVNVCLILVAMYASSAILGYLQQFIMATITQKTSKNLRKDLNNKINKLPLSYFDKTTKGDVLSRVTNDVDTLGQALSSSFANLVFATVLFFGVVISMFLSNWILALTTIASSTLGFFAMGLVMKKSQKHFNAKQELLGVMNGQIEEVYTNHNIVKSFNGIDEECETFNKTNKKLYNVDWKSQFLSGLMMPIMSFVGNFSYLMVFVVGVALIVSGNPNMDFGKIIAFVIYSRLFSQPLSTFAQGMTAVQQASASSKRIFDMLEEQEMQDESEKSIKLSNVIGNVVFEHVNFSYDLEKPIIKDFNAEIKAGQKVAIVGPTGAGKTTLVNLLMRFYEVDSGDIFIDGVSIKSMARKEVHSKFDMILQDTWLFSGTIRENLVYNKPNVSQEELDKACEAVGLKHFISTLENGYDTRLDDNANLSEGQKQQLTIARAMIKNSSLLILDEATSNVDTRMELKIQKAMDDLTIGRTSFIIAHRLSTIKNADIILVVRDGDIVERGNHSELLAKNGYYAELYNSQFSD